ncbi:MAG: DJ-1/PfpI family protein [Bacilli bacterium]
MKLLMILTNEFEEIEALGTIALLRRANCEVDIYSLHGESLIGRYDISINELHLMNELNINDYGGLIIAGGPQYKELELDKKFIDIVIDFYRKKKYICAICAGPTILGHLGILKDKKYTCFTSMNEEFGGTYIDQYVVVDKNIITARSAAATIDFAFAIIKTIYGEELEAKIKKQIYY